MSKLLKSKVEFEHPAKGAGRDRCSGCIHFLRAQLRCDVIAGIIHPGDWCDHFKRKSSTHSQVKSLLNEAPSDGRIDAGKELK